MGDIILFKFSTSHFKASVVLAYNVICPTPQNTKYKNTQMVYKFKKKKKKKKKKIKETKKFFKNKSQQNMKKAKLTMWHCYDT